MYKGKTSSKLSKCIKITGSGKIMRKMCGKNHMLDKKSNARKRKLNKKTVVSNGTTKAIRKSLNI